MVFGRLFSSQGPIAFPRLILLGFLAGPVAFVLAAWILAVVLHFSMPNAPAPIPWHGVPSLTIFHDFYAYYGAASHLLLGQSAYNWSWYLGTPMYAWFLVVFCWLPFMGAAVAYQTTWFLALGTFVRAEIRRLDDRGPVIAAFLLFLATSASFAWAILRANVDPMVTVFLSAALYAIATGREKLAGLCIAAATCAKYYAALLLLALEAMGIRRAANVMYACLVVAFIVTGPTAWLRPFGKAQMLERLGYLMPDGNLSVSHVWWSIARVMGWANAPSANTTYFVLSLTFLVVAFATALVLDSRRQRAGRLVDRAAELALYLPFFVAFPRQVYPYQAMVTLPVFFAVLRLVQEAKTEPQRRALLALAVGIGLQHSHSYAVGHLLQALGIASTLVHTASSFGTLVAVVAAVRWKWTTIRAEAAP